jgi:hypothetical protein
MPTSARHAFTRPTQKVPPFRTSRAGERQDAALHQRRRDGHAPDAPSPRHFPVAFATACTSPAAPLFVTVRLTRMSVGVTSTGPCVRFRHACAVFALTAKACYAASRQKSMRSVTILGRTLPTNAPVRIGTGSMAGKGKISGSLCGARWEVYRTLVLWGGADIGSRLSVEAVSVQMALGLGAPERTTRAGLGGTGNAKWKHQPSLVLGGRTGSVLAGTVGGEGKSEHLSGPAGVPDRHEVA